MMVRIGFGSFLSLLSSSISFQTPWNLNNSEFSMGWDLTGTELGSKVQSWSCSSNLSPTGILHPVMIYWSLSWLRPFLSLLGDGHQLPHGALSTECLPHLCSPTGGWVLCLSTTTPLLAPAGTTSPLPRARRSFHHVFPVLTPFPWCYCQTPKLAVASSAAVL